MKRYCSSIPVLSALLMVCSVSVADQQVIFGENRDLLLRLEGMQTNSLASSVDETSIVRGLKSSYDEIRVAAVKVIMIHRLEDLWAANSTNISSVVGTSKKLEPIVNAVLTSPQSREKPIIDLLPEQIVDLLPLRTEPQYPRAKNGDVPIEDVLLDVAVEDIDRIQDPSVKDAVRGRLMRFRLTASQERKLSDSPEAIGVRPKNSK